MATVRKICDGCYAVKVKRKFNRGIQAAIIFNYEVREEDGWLKRRNGNLRTFETRLAARRLCEAIDAKAKVIYDKGLSFAYKH